MPDGPPHPLAGRTGDGPPLAPVGWKWAAGRRNTDTYFFSPQGEKFRSRLQLESYLGRNPDGPTISEFRWRVSANEFKDGLLPGTLWDRKRVGRPMKNTKAKRKKMAAPGNSTLEVGGKRAVVGSSSTPEGQTSRDCDGEISVELVEDMQEFDIFEQEAVIAALQKKFNEEVIELRKAEGVVAAQRIIVEKAQEQLKKAEAEVAVRAERLHSISIDTRRAQKRLDMLLQNHKPKPFSEDEIKSQRRVLEIEVSDLKNLLRKIAHLNFLGDEFFTQFAVLLESQKVQKEKVDSAQAKLRRMGFYTRSQ